MSDEIINIVIGYDRRIPVASSTLMHSITARSSKPVRFTLLNLDQLQAAGLYYREVNPLQSTEFSFSRFLAPYLSNYEGWTIFMDNDIILLDDIAKLWDLRDDKYSVMCVQHRHEPKENEKFMGEAQTKYEKKNWSSVMMFNNAKCKALTPKFANEASGLELHQFKWLDSDEQIGELPQKWNYLADYTKLEEKPGLVHFTTGGPFYPEFKDTEFATEWYREFAAANNCEEADMLELIEIYKTKVNK